MAGIKLLLLLFNKKFRKLGVQIKYRRANIRREDSDPQNRPKWLKITVFGHFDSQGGVLRVTLHTGDIPLQ